MDNLIPRGAAPLLGDLIDGLRAVVVNGPRQSGKTTLLRQYQQARGGEYVSLDDVAVRRAALADPVGFISDRQRPAFIDEVQRGGDELIRAIKLAVDDSRERGQFILSGSSRFLTVPTLSESLAGRIGFVKLWQLSMSERTGGPSDFLKQVFTSPKNLAASGSEWRRAEYLDLLTTGGFPEIVASVKPNVRPVWFETYLDTVIRRDITEFAQIQHVDGLITILRQLAARTGSPVVTSDLARDAEISRDTVRNYLSYLNTVFLTMTVPVWSANLNVRAVKAPRVYLCDTGLAAHLADVDTAYLQRPSNSVVGGLVETFVLTELVKLKAMTSARVSVRYFRESNGREIDFVLERPRGDIVAVEVKSTEDPPRNSGKHLAWLRDKVGDRFTAGFVLHLGRHHLSLSDRIWAVPASVLWGHAPTGELPALALTCVCTRIEAADGHRAPC